MRGLLPFYRGLCTLSNRQARRKAGIVGSRCGFCGTQSNSKAQPSFGLLFDIDGVLVRGKMPIPAAKKAFEKLVDSQGQFVVPVVFVTNAGNCLRQTKADQLSHILGVPITQEQVIMSHSPLRMLKKYHDKCVLVSGQGPVLEIAKNLGFQNVVSIDMLRESFPLLDMVDHNRRPKLPSNLVRNLPKVEVVILFGEPIRWETNLQLIIDILLTNGNLSSAHQTQKMPHLPLLACNMDLMWMAEAQSPRFGHGTFLVCLENIYKKITGEDLKYEALMGKPSELTYHFAEYLIRCQAVQKQWKLPVTSLYAIGDNLMTDIYGANLYNRYLEERVARKNPKAVAKMAAATGSTTAVPQDEETDNLWESELALPSATSCKSILVCTGVYNPNAEVPTDANHCIKETVFHGHRDFRFDPALVEPGHIVKDVAEAVDVIFEQEKFVPQF
ncbi:haloacid dehalogenase-like hydrolase domain-containing 5 [Sphaeramia orbicularis]|uniref:haloacid dehalogenase-like hydrolase domain-containing 5 n=1 Tax=Sphaeramia orbicularis TaxID=375764 RepID=UPI00117DBAB5|nr:haloacid dehalogenase-like hydrolase domain-containing 5 [Sphaeramia orbicularis]XP_029994163.1 haloacid dehalogenase-like hydrolase domain-containing 5 [Sphaeramia orbicularis]